MTANQEASIKQRLLNLARERKEDYDFVLRQYAMQRLLYRLSISKYSDQFLLKGALLFWIWNNNFHRPTVDIDLLGSGNNDPEYLLEIFNQITTDDQDDGLRFDKNQLQTIIIKEDAKYPGVRISGKAFIGNTRIPFQIDIGFGDVVTPSPELKKLPSFLDAPAAELNVYLVYTVIAEKFHAMVLLGIANSRMKDFYDLTVIMSNSDLEGAILSKAISATFAKRETLIRPEELTIFTHSFIQNEAKQIQWKAFIRKNDLDITTTFPEIMVQIEKFLLPAYTAITHNNAFDKKWTAGNNWV